MKTVYFFTASLLLTLFVSFNSYAGLIVESIDTALERNIFAPNPTGAAPATKKTPASVKKTPSVNPSQNSSSESVPYTAGVVQKFFGNQNSLVLVDLDDVKTSAHVLKGQYLAVRVVEDENTQWNFENTSSKLKFVKKEKHNGVLILLYQAVNTGGAQLNFDLMSGTDALFSRILNVRVL